MCYLSECYELQKDPQLIAAFTISVPCMHGTFTLHQAAHELTSAGADIPLIHFSPIN